MPDDKHDTDPCSAPAPCDWAKQHETNEANWLATLRQQTVEDTKRLSEQIDRLERRIGWLEASDETTMAETMKAKAAQHEQKARLDLHEARLIEARVAGADAGKAEARALQRAQRKFYLSAAAVLVAVATAIPVLLQHYAGCSPPAASSISK